MIACMPSPVHDSGIGFAGDVLQEMREAIFLSRTERRHIFTDAGTDVALPTLSSLSRAGSKSGGTAVKQPDAAYYFIDRTSPAESDRCPRVVFEIGFSQSYESLCQDAKHWLLRAAGFVKLVVLVKLAEGAHPEAQVDNEEIATKLREQILAIDTADLYSPTHPDLDVPSTDVDSPPTAEDSPKPTSHPAESDIASPPPPPASPTSSHSSTAADYENYFKCDPSPWVGPIAGFIELYRYDAARKSVYQDGPRCVRPPPLSQSRLYTLTLQQDIFTPVPADQLPKLKITDLLPMSHIEGDASREFALPLEMYREHIAVGVHKLTANRRASAHVVRRKRKMVDDSGKFVPSVGEEGDEQVMEVGRKRRRGAGDAGAR